MTTEKVNRDVHGLEKAWKTWLESTGVVDKPEPEPKPKPEELVE